MHASAWDAAAGQCQSSAVCACSTKRGGVPQGGLKSETQPDPKAQAQAEPTTQSEPKAQAAPKAPAEAKAKASPKAQAEPKKKPKK